MYDNEEFRKVMDKLSPAGRASFEKCKEFSDLFKPAVGKSGFFAWDIALGVDIIRESVFCDYLDEPTARKMMVVSKNDAGAYRAVREGCTRPSTSAQLPHR